MNYLKKHWRAILFVIGLLIMATVSVMGWYWTEVAKTKFWWTFWVVAALLCLPGFVGAIAWFGSQKNKKW